MFVARVRAVVVYVTVWVLHRNFPTEFNGHSQLSSKNAGPIILTAIFTHLDSKTEAKSIMIVIYLLFRTNCPFEKPVFGFFMHGNDQLCMWPHENLSYNNAATF